MMRKRDFWNHWMVAVAGAASFATLISFLFGWNGSSTSVLPYLLTVLILIVCFGYAWWMSRIVKRIEIEISEKFKLTIEEGNLLDRNLTGVIVIPVNCCFNPNLVTRKTSVFKSFIDSLWEGREKELKEKILRGLQTLPDSSGTEVDENLNTSFELGTCIEVMDGGNTYVLVSAAKKDSNNASILERSDYPKVIEKLFNYLERKHFDKKIYLPLLGTGHGRLTKSPRRTLYYLLDTIEFKQYHLSFTQGICIKLRSLRASGINLNDIEHDFRLNLKEK